MKLLVALCLFGLTVCGYGFSVQSSLNELTEGFSIDNELMGVEHKGHCACNKFGCWCHAVDAGVKVHAVFSVDECRHNNPKGLIEGTFFVGNKFVEKQFPVDRFEDFCEEFDNKRFCFRVDINDKSDKGLQGCLRMSRPQKVDMGCFELPLMTSSNSDDSTEYEMEIPPQLAGVVNGKGKCMCCEHGCACQGRDDGYKVVVILSLDECNHDDKYHKVIEGLFKVGNVTFEMEFHADEFKTFCKRAEGQKFCFAIKIKHGCGCHIKGSISLTSPKKVDLGFFNLPMVTSSSDDDDDVDDDDVTTDSDQFISNDADEDQLWFLRNKLN